MSNEQRDQILAHLRLFLNGLCPDCDGGLDLYKCGGCQTELVTHQFTIDTEDDSSTGMLCLACYETGAPLPDWLKIEPLVECLHLNQTPGW